MYFIHLYHCYTDTATLNTIMSYSRTTDARIHRHTIPRDTVGSYICIIATQTLCTKLFHVLYIRFTCIQALIVPIFLFLKLQLLLHGLLLNAYSCIPVSCITISIPWITVTCIVLQYRYMNISCI